MKKAIAFILCLAMIAGSVVTSFAADKAIGTTLRLSKTEGTVTVKNASGKTQTTKADMKLYSGYTVKTAKRSYAYISLDDSKAIKLDASTEVEITKSGKKLEVFIKSGQIFFDVTEKLKSDESMNIRTSTMVTGIHGTAGVAGENNVILVTGSTISTPVDPAKPVPVGNSFGEGTWCYIDPVTHKCHYGYEAGTQIVIPSSNQISKVSNLSIGGITASVSRTLASNAAIGTSEGAMQDAEKLIQQRLTVNMNVQNTNEGSASNPNPSDPTVSSIGSITNLPGFVLKAITENPDTFNRLSSMFPDGENYSRQELGKVADLLVEIDNTIDDLYVPANSPTYADGTPNTQKPASTTNASVQLTKPLAVLEEDGTNTMDEGPGEDVITPPTPPVIEDDYYEPPTPATPTDLTVSFYDTDGITLLGSVTVPSGGNVAASGAEFLSDYPNDTWTKNGKDYDLSTAVTENISLVKKSPVTYTVTLPNNIIGTQTTFAAFSVLTDEAIGYVPAGGMGVQVLSGEDLSIRVEVLPKSAGANERDIDIRMIYGGNGLTKADEGEDYLEFDITNITTSASVKMEVDFRRANDATVEYFPLVAASPAVEKISTYDSAFEPRIYSMLDQITVPRLEMQSNLAKNARSINGKNIGDILAVAAISELKVWPEGGDLDQGGEFGTMVADGDSVNVPDGKTLIIKGADAGADISGEIIVIVNGTLELQDAVTVNGSISNNGTLTMEAAELKIEDDGTIENNGTIENRITIKNYGTITNNGTINNDGRIENNGEIINPGTINIKTGGIMLVDYYSSDYIGKVNNTGTIITTGALQFIVPVDYNDGRKIFVEEKIVEDDEYTIVLIYGVNELTINNDILDDLLENKTTENGRTRLLDPLLSYDSDEFTEWDGPFWIIDEQTGACTVEVKFPLNGEFPGYMSIDWVG